MTITHQQIFTISFLVLKNSATDVRNNGAGFRNVVVNVRNGPVRAPR